MTDPVLIVLVVVCGRCVSQLADALAQRIVLRARAELARIVLTAPPGAEVTELNRRGDSVRILVPARAGRDS